MIRKRTAYALAKGGWLLLVAGVTVAVYTGRAEPFVPASRLPWGPPAVAAVAVGVVAAGMLFVMVLEHRSWQAMGRSAGLAPESGSFLPVGKPPLAGRINGRPVRVRINTRKTGGGSEGGSNRSTYMVVEADLQGPAQAGAIISETEPGESDRTKFDFGTLRSVGDRVDDRFVASAGSGDLVGAVLTEPVRDTLVDLHTVDKLLVGDAAGTITGAVPDMGDSLLGSLAQDKIETDLSGDASTVTHEMDTVFLDGDELLRQIRAVVAVADAFEASTADGGEDPSQPARRHTQPENSAS